MTKLKRKIWIKTYGCQMNMRDSDTLKALLLADGHIIVDNEKEADIALLNTCSVRELAETKAIGKAGRLLKNKQKNPRYRVGILGCMAARKKQHLLEILPNLDWIIPSQALSEIPTIIRTTLKEKEHEFLNTGIFQAPQPHAVVVNTTKNFNFNCYEQPIAPVPVLSVPIQQGCSMHCSYCIVPTTRGQQQNRPFASILTEIRQAAQAGTREVILLGQIVNAYYDSAANKNFIDLLETIQAIDGIERIRFMSPHPAFFTKQLIQCFTQLPKLCPAVHLPIQSGSNRILQQMHRGYTREKILEIVSVLRSFHPQMSFSTDIIVGYPDETDIDFEQTQQLFESIAFDMAYIFKYSPRPTTSAASQQNSDKGISNKLKEHRNQILLECLTRISTHYNQQFLHTQQMVLVEGAAHRGPNKLFGRNIYNKKVIFDGPIIWIGSFKTVFINKTTSSVLEGVVKT